MTKKNVMIDLETMDNLPTSAIVSIGAVAFDSEGLGAEFFINVTLASSMEAGMTVGASTVEWWLKQSDAARLALLENQTNLRDALLMLAAFIDTETVGHEDVIVWGNGPSFDNAVLHTAYAAVGFDLPWRFWNDQCHRTAKRTAPHIEMKRVGDAHNALDDARSQAYQLIDVMNETGLWK